MESDELDELTNRLDNVNSEMSTLRDSTSYHESQIEENNSRDSTSYHESQIEENNSQYDDLESERSELWEILGL